MPDRGEKSTSRKAARELPLTHRQQKSKKQPQTQAGAKVSASTPRKTTSSARGNKASAVPVVAAPTVEMIDVRQPEPVLTAPAVDEAPADADRLESFSHMDTTLLEPPSARSEASPAPVMEPVADTPVATPPGEQPARGEASEPIRQKVRVRRKRPVVDPIKPDFTREDTIPLETLGDIHPSQPSLVIVTPVALDGSPMTSAESTPVIVPAEMEHEGMFEPTTILAPTTVLKHTHQVEPETILDVTTALEPTKTLTSAAAGMDATTILEPTKRLEPTTMLKPAAVPEAEPAAQAGAEETAPSEPESLEEPESVTPAPRSPRMPTLAVMAALAPRPEAEPPSAAHAPEIVEALSEDIEPEAAPAERALVEQPEITLEAPPSLSTNGGSAASEPQRERHHGIQGMWWPLAAMRRSAPDTRPVAPPLTSLEGEIETTAPHASARRRSANISDREMSGAATSQSSKPSTDSHNASFTFDLPEIDESGAFGSRASRVRQLGPRRPQRTLVLTWTSGGHAGVASVAALIAVIAALRSGASAGAGALTVFYWALSLTLIAGVGAAIGYICVQVARPKLATLALLISQVTVFMWALALIGPRAALLAMAPASVALALRGIGRASAVATAFAWMAVFIVDEVYTLAGGLSPALSLNAVAGALIDIAVPLVGVWLVVNVLLTLYTGRMQALSHGRALEHAVLLSEAELSRLRTQVEDDAETLRRALNDASHGEQPERVYAHGAFSAVADAVNDIADRLIDLRYDRAERKRLEAAIRRLTRVIERAWLGLAWSWPEATGTILDDLLALLRTPPPPDAPVMLDETTPTGQVVAPHLFRGWQPTEQRRAGEQSHAAQPKPETGPRILPSQPSQPSMPSLWPSNPGAGLIESLELPPYPKWRSPDSRPAGWSEANEG